MALITTSSRTRVYRIIIAAAAVFMLGPSALSASSTTKTFPVSVTIKPELSLEVNLETGSTMDFGTVLSSNTEPRLSKSIRMDIRVFSNMGSVYEVTHQWVNPLANDSGAQLQDALYFGPSTDAVSTEQTVSLSPVVISSNSRGESLTESVYYQLNVPASQSAGSYEGTLLLTIVPQ